MTAVRISFLKHNTAAGRSATLRPKRFPATCNLLAHTCWEQLSAGDICYRFEDPFFAVRIEILPRKSSGDRYASVKAHGEIIAAVNISLKWVSVMK